ncbi:MAG: hypothetical protein WC227_00340 [Patescibacteria group bacterium]
MKKILLFARDPGGANTVIPLFEPLKQRGYKVVVFGKDVAMTRFNQNGIHALPIAEEIKEISPKEIKGFLLIQKPDFIITGTSADDMTEKYLWSSAMIMDIPSFAILDQWVNYGIRFSKWGVSNVDKYKKNPQHEYLPSKILVMDELAKSEAILAGLPVDRILVSGQPYFEYLKNREFDTHALEKIRKKYRLSHSNYVVTYASEPIRKIYGDAREHFGYDEITTFCSLHEALSDIEDVKKNFKISLIIKLHPKEDESYYDGLINKLKSDNIKVYLDRDSCSQDLIKISDLVCGMSSMFLLESYILGKPTISIQIGLKGDNPFVLDRIGLMRSILDQGTLNFRIKSAINGGREKMAEFKLIKDPVKRVIDYMEQSLCQN